MNRRLPADYQSRTQNEHFIDVPTTVIHQHHVYELLGYLAEKSGVTRIIDIGCGSAEKLRGFDEKFEIICIDAEPVRELIAANVPKARFIECDLEKGIPNLPPKTLQGAIVICSDVIEHLREPEILISNLAKFSRECAYVLISTPDRVRARGLLDMGPPANPAHTMEWTAEELGRLMIDCGFSRGFFIGYTLNNDFDLAKNTILAISGCEATYSPPAAIKSVAAVINVYNELDVIGHVAWYLKSQGVKVHIIDNWSTDGSYETAQSLVTEGICENVARFPDKPTDQYQWHDQLLHTAEYASRLSDDWIIHYDADEFRQAPWPNVTLAEAISFVDERGYNAIDFTVLNFAFTEDEKPRAFSPHNYRFFDFGRFPGHLLQIKAWKNSGQVVDLASTGGHIAQFDGLRVFPLKFLNCHYPLRSYEQANKKVFRERLPRVGEEKQARGWHLHYDTYEATGTVEPWRKYELLNFDPKVFAPEFLVERLSGIGIELDGRAIPNINTRFAQDEFIRRSQQKVSEQIQELTCTAVDLRQESKGLEQENKVLKERNAELEAKLDDIHRSKAWRIVTIARKVLAKVR